MKPEKTSGCEQSNEPQSAAKDPHVGAMQVQPRRQEPNQNQGHQQHAASHPVDDHVPPSYRGNWVATLDNSDAPAPRTILKIRKRTAATANVATAPIINRFSQGSDWTNRIASAGRPPRGDSAGEAPRIRRI